MAVRSAAVNKPGPPWNNWNTPADRSDENNTKQLHNESGRGDEGDREDDEAERKTQHREEEQEQEQEQEEEEEEEEEEFVSKVLAGPGIFSRNETVSSECTSATIFPPSVVFFFQNPPTDQSENKIYKKNERKEGKDQRKEQRLKHREAVVLLLHFFLFFVSGVFCFFFGRDRRWTHKMLRRRP